MKRGMMTATGALALMVAAAALTGVQAQEIRLLAGDTGTGGALFEEMAKSFEEANPGVDVVVEEVSYQTIVESLPVQLEAGEGPDIAIITDLGGLSRFYLDITDYVDADYFEKEWGQTLAWLRGGRDTDAIFGMPTTLTVNGAYVNLTLFEQAGVPVPEEGATWQEWAEATRQVAEATGTDFAMEMDRSGHRFASLAISYGAELVDEEGKPVVDDGLRAAIEQFVEWHENGTMPMDLWGAVGGSTHRELFSDFLNANVVLYFGGSWTLAQMDTEVGDLFDWAVMPAPCGPSSCTVMPGGGAMTAFAHTEHPELAGKLINHFAQPENLDFYISNEVEIPSAASQIANGVEYPDASERTKEALATFTAQIPKMADAAYRFQGWRYQRAMMNALTTRISQVLNNELDVDGALERIEEDVNLAIEAAEGQS
ncbi:ABC transporter substrate-binding protein [Devosia nitrariae]|uniref:Sugar ABC transporter substrate-binding protein n=1 Tax=Devosia nitrariae TaxID=2071872 RepID=A0ABQ5W4J0_9HYPH|nr:extracellular solute-binding protein [Devosia nitrariae]GLQ54787.1 sugar ABC transporter substrate-binding protein [Devosia nitrariae]